MKMKRASLWALLLKIGTKLLSVIVKFAKAFKFLKLGLAVASFAGYALLFSWKFAVLIMIALAWHESGHVWAMKKSGIKTKGFYFIPFLGGAAIAEERYKSYGQNAFIAIMGPIWGALLSIASLIVFYVTDNPLFAAAASWMALINLFNLFPIVPLDGGQLIRSIAFSISKNLGFIFLIVSFIGVVFLTFELKIMLFGIFILVGGAELLMEFNFRNKNKQILDKLTEEEAAEFRHPYPSAMNVKQLTMTILSYVITAAILIIVMKLTNHIPGADLASQFLN